MADNPLDDKYSIAYAKWTNGTWHLVITERSQHHRLYIPRYKLVTTFLKYDITFTRRYKLVRNHRCWSWLWNGCYTLTSSSSSCRARQIRCAACLSQSIRFASCLWTQSMNTHKLILHVQVKGLGGVPTIVSLTRFLFVSADYSDIQSASHRHCFMATILQDIVGM